MAMSPLDWTQVIKSAYDDTTGILKVGMPQAYDAVNGAIKVIPSSATTFAVELDAADGDSVMSAPMIASTQMDILSSTPLGQIMIIDASFVKSYNMFFLTTLATASAAQVQLQVSPLATGNFWVTAGSNFTSSTSAATATTVIVGGNPVIAKRIRINLTQVPSNTVSFVLVTSSI